MTLSAQNYNKITADQHFDRLEYAYAIEDYLQQIKEGKATPRVFERLAIAYKKTANYSDAERYYRRLAKGKNAEPRHVYAWAQMLKANGQYDQYTRQMLRFVEMRPEDPKALSYKADLETLTSIRAQKPKYTVARSGFNSRVSDFGAVRYADTLYFASAKAPMKKNHGWTDQSFLDIYTATIGPDGAINRSKPISERINTKYHEGILTMTAAGDRIYFDRNNFTNGKYVKDSTGVNQLQLYYANRKNGAFAKAEPLPFNDNQYSSGHPMLSHDGTYLYFSSDRPGGLGQADIWRVYIAKDGSFGTPENLGAPVNTAGKETFPFLKEDGQLYFTSDGHVGLGGFDIFGYDGEIVFNLGAPINTGADDFSMRFDPDGVSGYLASNRKRRSDDDIYRFEVIPPCTANISFYVRDQTRAPLANADLIITNEKDQRIEIVKTDAFGGYVFASPCDQNYTVQVMAQGYEEITQAVAVGQANVVENLALETALDVEITKDRVLLNPIYFDFDKWDITPLAAQELDRLVAVMQRYPSMVISAQSHTDNRGDNDYNLILSDKRAKSMRDYIIAQGISARRITGIGRGETDPAVDCKQDCTEEEHQLNRRSEFVIISQ